MHFRKVPYILSDEMKETRVDYARTMLDVLKKEEGRNFQSILTMDETPLYYDNNRKIVWISEEDVIPNITKDSLRKKKFTLSVMWGVGGIAVVKGLKGENKVNSEYFCNEILSEALKWCEKKRYQTGVSSFIFHMDNAPCHNSNATKVYMFNNNIHRMVHPPYSPDLAPCDFFLFGYMKNEFADTQFNNIDEAVERISTWLNSIPKKVRLDVFQNWKVRLQACIDCGGDYVFLDGTQPNGNKKLKRDLSPTKKNSPTKRSKNV